MRRSQHKNALVTPRVSKTTTGAVVLGAADKAVSAVPAAALPKRRLGKTGEMVSRIGFGCGTRFCFIESEDAAQALLERAFNLGVNYFDTGLVMSVMAQDTLVGTGAGR